jgi:hypothetical protein
MIEVTQCPCQVHKGYEELKPGMVVNVFIQQDDGKHKFEGKAKLIEELRTWYTPEPFPIIDHCPICKQTTNNIKEKWLVQLVTEDPFVQSATFVRHIHKFHSYGTPHVRDEVDVEERDDWYENNEDEFD